MMACGHGKRVEKTMVKKIWRRLPGDERGVTALEYALIAALVAVVIIGGVSLLGTNISTVFSTVATTI
jgi:pilus assembly protein Flp/PilA